MHFHTVLPEVRDLIHSWWS